MSDKIETAPLESTFKRWTCPAWAVTLYIGGDAAEVKRALAVVAAGAGACWSVEPTEFIYSGGREQGVIVRRIAYARFPSDAPQAMADMELVGRGLAEHMGQASFTVIGPETSVFVSRRRGE